MKKIIFLFFILTSMLTFSENLAPKKDTAITLENNNTENKNYNVEVPASTTKEKEKYEYYEKHGDNSPQFENLSFFGKVGVTISSWFAPSDTYEHMDNKDNSNLDEKLDTSNREID